MGADVLVYRVEQLRCVGSLAREEVEPEARPASNEQVGIDVGLKTFAYLSTGSRSRISAFSGKRNTTWPVRTAGSLEQRGGPKSERGGAR